MSEQIPPFRLQPVPLTPEAEQMKGFRAAADEVGTRHRLGGEPDWQQEELVPSCPVCGERMTFYGQLDSINDRFVLADCGIVYVFVCLDDTQATAFIQSG